MYQNCILLGKCVDDNPMRNCTLCGNHVDVLSLVQTMAHAK